MGEISTSSSCITGIIRAVISTLGIVILAVILLSVWPHFNTSAAGDVKVLRFGRVWTGTGKVINEATVIVENGRITSVSEEPPEVRTGVEIIDLASYTGIPGLIDVHTHITYYWDQSPGTRPWDQSEVMSPAVTVFLAQENARKTLEAGVTTIRDLGAFDPNTCVRMDIAMRDLINKGAMVGPRMFVAGYGLLPTFDPSQHGRRAQAWGQADGVDEVIRVVRREIAAGVDWIKMFASTGSADDVTGYQTYTFEEIEAAVRVGQSMGKGVAVHSYGPGAARDAVRAGANSVEHATDLDDETIEEMARRKIFYVPTVDHNRYYIENAVQFGYGPEVVKRLGAFIERNLETTRRALRAGVPIAMGSDAVFTMFGQNTRELGWFVKAGMTPEEALATATRNGAVLLGLEDKLGALLPGFFADIVAIEGDPLEDISTVTDGVCWVMKDGVVVVDNRQHTGMH